MAKTSKQSKAALAPAPKGNKHSPKKPKSTVLQTVYGHGAGRPKAQPKNNNTPALPQK
jgi:hypothetical protein